MSVEDNTRLVRHIMEAFANREGFALRDCFAEDAVWHVPGDGVMSGTFRGRAEIFRFLARLQKETNGTYRSTFVDALASEERGAGLYRAQGEREGARSTSTRCSCSRSRTGSSPRCWRCRATRRRSAPSGPSS